MLSLAQNSRFKQGSSGNLMPVSPVESPLLLSKGIRLRNTPLPVRRVPSLSQHHSTVTTASDVQPVDLNAESSSVTSFYAPRINSGKFCFKTCEAHFITHNLSICLRFLHSKNCFCFLRKIVNWFAKLILYSTFFIKFGILFLSLPVVHLFLTRLKSWYVVFV